MNKSYVYVYIINTFGGDSSVAKIYDDAIGGFVRLSTSSFVSSGSDDYLNQYNKRRSKNKTGRGVCNHYNG